MTPREITNVPASVHQRLKNHSDRTGRYFNEVLLNYGMERFLYRLSLSPSSRRFVLKGGLMLMVWQSAMHRPTRDIDLLGYIPNDPAVVATAIREACQQPVVDDGLIFDAESVQTAPIAVEKEYEGVRTTFSGRLARAIIHMQVDVGFERRELVDAFRFGELDVPIDLHASREMVVLVGGKVQCC